MSGISGVLAEFLRHGLPARAVAGWLMLASALLSSLAVADMLDTESLQPWETCALCHGLDGNSAMAKFPKLAGQKVDYLTKQIMDFKGGTRTNDGGQMVNMVTNLSAADIKQVADWFSNQTAPTPTSDPLPAKDLAAASALFNNGSENIPACASCHLADNTNIPYLQGQHASYIEKQLNDFQRGDRSNDRNIMQTIAQQLSTAEIEELAIYISSLPR